MANKPRLYQDVYNLLLQNPELSPSEAGRQLGYKQELHWKSKTEFRVGPKHRHSDGARSAAEHLQRIGPSNIPSSVPGFDRHHKRMIMLYRPLYEGLSDADSYKLSLHAVQQGMPLGNVDDNYQYLSKPDHNELHRYMEKQGMRPSDMPDFSKASLDNRIKSFDVLYRDFIQPDIDNKTASLIEAKSSVKAGKARLDYYSPGIKTPLSSNDLIRRRVAGLALAGLAAPSVLGTAASAVETADRTNLAVQTGNPLDYVQAGVSGLSLAADYVPVVGEFISTPADLANSMIDQHRNGGSTLNGSGNRSTRNGKNNGQVKVGTNNGNGGRSGAKRRAILAAKGRVSVDHYAS
jgi:hypothetical protein